MVKKKAKPGPKADTLNLEGGSWQSMMKKALEKKRPAGGWPEEAFKAPHKATKSD